MSSTPELEKMPEALPAEEFDHETLPGDNVNVPKLLRKLDMRILPFVSTLYLLSFL